MKKIHFKMTSLAFLNEDISNSVCMLMENQIKFYITNSEEYFFEYFEYK